MAVKPGDMHQHEDEPPRSPDLYQRMFALAVLAMCFGFLLGFVAGRFLQ